MTVKQATRYGVQQGWKVLVTDMGINAVDVLTLAGLPADLFSRKDVTLSVAEYFSFWIAVEKCVGETDMPLTIGRVISVEAFDPPVFASFCSPNLNVALQRISLFKKLIGPLSLTVAADARSTTATIEFYEYGGPIPYSLGASELVFFTQLARMATRHQIIPKRITMTALPAKLEPYEAFFGVPVELGSCDQIVFHAEDANRPFLTENLAMWDYFEPGLNRRLADLKVEENISQRVKSVLLKLLPSGQSSIEHAANQLAMSKRTIQRRLSGEETNYQAVLQSTREELAKHYLCSSSMSLGEISFLLAFQDTNSFIRAFQNWTGKTPVQFRKYALDLPLV